MRIAPMAALAAAALIAGALSPTPALAGERAVKSLGPEGSIPAKWNLAKPKAKPHADVAPPSAGGTGDGVNSVTFGAFDSGDIVVVLGTSTGHAGVFDGSRYSTLYSPAVLSANTSPKNGVQYEYCSKYRTYDRAWGLWVPNYAWVGTAVRNYCRSQLGEPYNIASSKSDETSWYCSKLAWSGWKRTASLDLDADGGYWVWPVDLVNSPRTAAFGYWN
jgi:hypothetical protein